MISQRTTTIKRVVFSLVLHLMFITMACYCHNTIANQQAPVKKAHKAPEPEELAQLQQDHEQYEQEAEEAESDDAEATPRRINKIIVEGMRFIPEDALLNRIPYKEGEIFDPSKTRRLIHNLYYELKRLRSVAIYGESVEPNLINLHIVIEEKIPLKEVFFEGNKQVTSKEIRDKINFTDVPSVDKEELKRYSLGIKKMYRDKGYHSTDISAELEIDDDGKADALFTITEHTKATVKRVLFTGNKSISGKKLRSVLFTREDWVLGFMDKAGTYQTDRIEADKHIIEQTYQNEGYINAKVVDAITSITPYSQEVTVTYEIQEGDQYTVSNVKASGNDILSDEYLVGILPLRAGDIYSKENLIESIRALEFIWGDMGYVYANIEPSVQPDEENKTVNVSFYTDLGKPVYLNKLTIKGNKKTRDKVVRRKISLEEGGLITNRHMEASKNRIEGLGYFDQRSGVNWKMTRLSEDLADLDLILKEVKTGSAHVQLGFGGSPRSIQSGSTGVSLEGTITDTNLFGSGMRVNLTGRVGADEKTVIFNLTNPWMFDRPIYGSMDLYHKRVAYDELQLTNPVNEKHSGGALTAGFVTGVRHSFFNDTFLRLGLGLDDIRYEGGIPRSMIKSLATTVDTLQANADYNRILQRMFDPGAFATLSANVGKDAKNHPMHPSKGYTWLARSQIAVNALGSSIGFHRFDLDANWYTPLIGDFDLVLRLHGYCGFINTFKNRNVPYRELFHIGGPASVRGFLFGQIGPQFAVVKNGAQSNDSIGGSKTFFANVELIFPIMPDFSIKGVVFYDGGAGWNNPYAYQAEQRFIKNNTFNYRHSVGAGVRLLNPMPIRVDWGFKLDPKKNEVGSEVHFNMSYDW